MLGAVLVMCLGPLLHFWRALFGSRSLERAVKDLDAVKGAPVWVPSELEISTARLRALRRRRRRDELDDWDRDFRALVPCTCRSCQ